MKNGFTLIELIVVIAITAVLSGIILFGITLYINKGKDSNISGNLAVLIPAGEVFYNATNTYAGFCDSSVVKNAIEQMPENSFENCPSNKAGVCCNVAVGGQAWAACAKRFASSSAYCVDSRGVKIDTLNVGACASGLTQCN